MIELSEKQQAMVSKSVSKFIRNMKNNSFIVLDLETNGLQIGIDDVLSISAQKCRIDRTGIVQTIDTYNRYYCCSTRYNPNATKVNGLIDDKTILKLREGRRYPKYFCNDIEAFTRFVGNTNSFIGHNIIGFDMGWLDSDICFDNVFDTMVENKWSIYNTSGRGPNLGNTVKQYELESDSSNFHASHYDTEMCVRIFESMFMLAKIRMPKLQEVQEYATV